MSILDLHPMPKLEPLNEAKLARLDPDLQAKVRALDARFEMWATLWGTYDRGLALGSPVKSLNGAKLAAEIKQIADDAEELTIEVDRRHPPSDEELERRAADRHEDILRDEIKRAVEYGMKVHKMADELLSDVVVDRAYRRKGEHVVKYAAGLLAPGRTPPEVKFTHPGYKDSLGYFDPKFPNRVYLNEGLDDYQLVEVACHEVSHWSTPHENGEGGARYDAHWLAQRYTREYGLTGPGGGWRMTA